MASSSVIQFTEGKWTSGKYIEVLGLKLPAVLVDDAALLAEFISSFKTRYQVGRKCFTLLVINRK